jgi:ABC-type bacteriocin/lantibiotic exporter with double-glycine peptidase domain
MSRHEPGREWIKEARARIRGAEFLGESETVLQARSNDCGAACLKMILSTRGIDRSLAELTAELGITARGTSLLRIRLLAGRLGVPARSWIIRPCDLDDAPLPAIAFINGDHFVVVRRFVKDAVLEVDDPGIGRLQWPLHSFRKAWSGQILVFDPDWAPPQAIHDFVVFPNGVNVSARSNHE